MFAKTIIDSDAFLDMPMSARLLYYDLSMRADDDGFNNSPKKVMRTIGATIDDMNILIARKFIIPFENGVVVIKHWRIHNYIRKDTYNETPYKEQKALLELDENRAYRIKKDDCLLSVDDPLTQDRLGKDSIGKVRIDKDSIDYNGIKDAYNALCPSLPSVKSLSDARKKAIKARLNTYSVDDFQEVFRKAEASDFLKGKNDRNWQANFDWMMKDANFAKILDGNYDNRQSRSQNRVAEKLDDFYDMAAQWAEEGE